MKLENLSLLSTCWFFDYDGTLCPHLEVWEKRDYDTVYIRQLLDRLAARAAGVFWNTGRRPESLGSVNAEYLKTSGYFIQGSLHWEAAKQKAQQLGPLLDDSFKKRITEFLKNESRVRLEIKTSSMRLAPSDVVHMPFTQNLAKTKDFEPPPDWMWVVGARGVELVHQDFNKSVALKTEMPKLPQSLPVALGDDVMDKFAVEEALARGGYAVLVGDECGWITELTHKTEQIVFCEGPQNVYDLLERMLNKKPQSF